ncbi:hypothetical protein PCE1_000249 [Barthelona sp. PCE]
MDTKTLLILVCLLSSCSFVAASCESICRIAEDAEGWSTVYKPCLKVCYKKGTSSARKYASWYRWCKFKPAQGWSRLEQPCLDFCVAIGDEFPVSPACYTTYGKIRRACMIKRDAEGWRIPDYDCIRWKIEAYFDEIF